jgi:hypothetical protein
MVSLPEGHEEVMIMFAGNMNNDNSQTKATIAIESSKNREESNGKLWSNQ